MPRLTHQHFARLAEEIGTWAGARVKAVHQEGERRFRLALEREGTRRDVVLDLDPDLPRAHLSAHVPAPGAPTALAHGLRNLIQGARLEGARALAGERALALTFSLAGLARTLWFEGFGRQANLYLLDEHGVVQATPRGDTARARNASVGTRFVALPPRADDDPAEPEPEGGASAAVEALARDAGDAEKLARRKKDLERWLKTSRSKAAGARAALEQMLVRAAQAPELRRKGELMRASFHLLREGQRRVSVPDHASDPPTMVELVLDPHQSPGEQVAACFHEAERAERGALEAEARLPAALEAGLKAERALARLGALGDLDELEALEAEVARGKRPARAPGAGPAPAAPWRTFRSLDGWAILVGKDARGNDSLTLKKARPGDLFLHVRAASGSHVIVPTPSGKSVPKETLLDAAELACLYSERSAAEHNEVDYVEKRHVRKPKGSPPGLVELATSKTLRVRRDLARRERLRSTPSQPMTGQ